MRRFRFYRKYKGGTWVKTKLRGWIRLGAYKIYVGYGFDPKLIRIEKWGCRVNKETAPWVGADCRGSFG